MAGRSDAGKEGEERKGKGEVGVIETEEEGDREGDERAGGKNGRRKETWRERRRE